MNNNLSIKVIVGSTREGRFGDKAAAWIENELNKHEGLAVEIVDLRDYEMPFFDNAISPSFIKEPYTNEAVKRFTQKIEEGDAFIVVTPEYNHGTSGVLKNAFDWVSREWNEKPIAFVSYGSVGGARAVEQLRLTAIELQMAPIREAVHLLGNDYFPVYFGKADAGEMFIKYEEKVSVTIEQLLKWAKALKEMRG